MKLITLRP